MKIESQYTRQQIEAMSIRKIRALGLPKYSIQFHGHGILSERFENYVIDHIRAAYVEAKASGRYHTYKMYQDGQLFKSGLF